MLFDLARRRVVARSCSRVRDRRRASCPRSAGDRDRRRADRGGRAAHRPRRRARRSRSAPAMTSRRRSAPASSTPGPLVVRARHRRGRRHARRAPVFDRATRALRPIRGARSPSRWSRPTPIRRARSSSRTRAGCRAAPCAGRRELLGLAERRRARRARRAAPPGADGVTFIPALAGAMTPVWRPHARGTLHGLDRGARSLAHRARGARGPRVRVSRRRRAARRARPARARRARARRRRRRAGVDADPRRRARLPHHVAARTDTCRDRRRDDRRGRRRHRTPTSRPPPRSPRRRARSSIPRGNLDEAYERYQNLTRRTS